MHAAVPLRDGFITMSAPLRPWQHAVHDCTGGITMSTDADGAAARYGQIKQLFNAVCDLPSTAAQRAALQALGVDRSTQAQVLAMLAPAGGVTRFSSAVAQTTADWQGTPLRSGDRLGPWTLLRPLGEGGMGRVFLAERSDGHYQQQVAIKLLLGWSGPAALARLTAERQLLARMNHAHIAKLLDGGSTPAGQPYLVMEYAEGDTIDVWCEQHRLPLVGRLALFQTVCDGVAHAHRHRVIHCDIKPANVLINAEGRAMLLDFGIAQLQGQGDTALAMTPHYASPEQAAGLAPGMASDIFSLGRLLAELLRPLAASHRRGPELAAVVSKATATDPDQRYDSVGALQRDLHRLLAHQPLAALRGHRAHGLRKGLRRHWPWVLVGAAVLALTAGLGVALVHQLEQTQAAAARADQADARRREALARALAAEAKLAAATGRPAAMPMLAPTPGQP